MATTMSMRKIRKRRPRKRRPPTLTCEGGVLTYRSKPLTLELLGGIFDQVQTRYVEGEGL